MKKSVLCLALAVCLLTGCGGQEEVLPAAQRALPEGEVQLQAVEVPSLQEQVLGTYRAITEGLTFTVSVDMLPEDRWTILEITPDNAYYVKSGELALQEAFHWIPATQQDWEAQGGYLLTLQAQNEDVKLRCCQNGDVVLIQQADQFLHLRAVPAEEADTAGQSVYDALLAIAEGAVRAQVWSDPVADGGIPERNAVAADLCVQIAENYQNVPDWVSWKPEDIRPGNVRVYDVNDGVPAQFCVDMEFWVRLQEEDPYWQTGTGLTEHGKGALSGYWKWELQVQVAKDANGDWRCVDQGAA